MRVLTPYASGLVGFCLALPWISPLASGPSSAAMPLMVSALCAALVLLQISPAGLANSVTIFLIALSGLFMLAVGQFSSDLAATGLAVLLIAIGATVAGQARQVPLLMRAVVGAWLVAALLSAAMGVAQNKGWAEAFAPWISASPDGTAYANLRQRNQLASLTNMGIAALAWFTHQRAAKGNAQWGVRSVVGAGLAVALLAYANALTGSRTGFAQVILLAALGWLWRAQMARGARHVLWGAAGAYLLLAPLIAWWTAQASNALPTAFGRLTVASEGCSGRGVLWSNTVELILQKPWTGWGWRELAWAHYQGVFERNGGERFCLIVDNAHNLPLHLAVELGLPAALVIFAVLGWGFWRAKPWRETDPTRQLAWAVLAVMGVHSLVEYPLWYGPFQLAAGLAVGLLCAASKPTFDQNTRSASVAWHFVAIALIATTIWASWDYRRVSQIYLPQDQRDEAYQGDTLGKIGDSWWFGNQLAFARLSITPLTAANAAQQRQLATQLMHYSPEPRVIEALIESTTMVGDLEAAVAELKRYKAAFPQDYERWSQRNTKNAQ